jgi:hypothetical protein
MKRTTAESSCDPRAPTSLQRSGCFRKTRPSFAKVPCNRMQLLEGAISVFLTTVKSPLHDRRALNVPFRLRV